jgi:hypothetical protein
MRTDLVEVPPPLFDQNLRLGARTKPFEAETLVAELAVEALREAEVAALLASHADKLTEDDRQRLVRQGHLPEREIITGIGPVAVR